MEETLKECEKQGWIFIGEIEFKHSPFSIYIDNEPVFLYAKTVLNEEQTNVFYIYGFGRGINTPTRLFNFEMKKRYSITTVLQWCISHDVIFSGPDERRELSGNKQAVRLAGMTEWIFPNEDFLNKKTEIYDLEKLWRTDKEAKIVEQFQKNQFASKEDKEKALKEGFYKI
jgi:hypothetical protein